VRKQGGDGAQKTGRKGFLEDIDEMTATGHTEQRQKGPRGRRWRTGAVRSGEARGRERGGGPQPQGLKRVYLEGVELGNIMEIVTGGKVRGIPFGKSGNIGWE